MKAAYVQLVTELQGRAGLNVAPDPSADAPSDERRRTLPDRCAIKGWGRFVHLVGDSGPTAPEGLGNIVTLQLAPAAPKPPAEGTPGQELSAALSAAKILDDGGAAPKGPAASAIR